MSDAHGGWPGSVWSVGDPAPTGTLVRITGTPKESRWSLARVLCTVAEYDDGRPAHPLSGYFVVVGQGGELFAEFPPRCIPVELDREGTEEMA